MSPTANVSEQQHATVVETPAEAPNASFSKLTLEDLDNKQIAGYVLGKTIGRGSVAVVKLGTHFATGKKVAIKILKPKNIQEQKETIREIEILSRLQHPNIVKMYKVVRELGYTCIILEYAEQGELFDHVLELGKFEEDKARAIFRQVLSAVQYLHANLIVHRDIKPENILVDGEGNVKLSDFGLSNVLRPGKLFSTFCGSPIYTPPEVVLQQQYCGLQMDVWSLGVVLYVMVTGGMPWKLVHNRVQNMNDLLRGHYKIPEFFGLSDSCKDLIRRMVVADSTQRATLQEVCSHPWVLEGYNCAPSPNLPNRDVVAEPNELILREIEKLGLESSRVLHDVTTNPGSPALTTYHVLQDKMKFFRETVSIITDETIINSPKADLRRTVLTPPTHRRTVSHPSPSVARRIPSRHAEAETVIPPAPIPVEILPAQPLKDSREGNHTVSTFFKNIFGKLKRNKANSRNQNIVVNAASFSPASRRQHQVMRVNSPVRVNA